MSRRILVLVALTCSALFTAVPEPATAGTGGDLLAVWRATARYHAVGVAERDGYERFLECFDHPRHGGMGQHYVDLAALDGRVTAEHPEALVYEVGKDRLRLVAVEYVVPVDRAPDPPRLFGQTFHLNDAGDAWILHVWIWRHNPAGLFADYNPRVRPCPAEGS